MSVDHLTLYLKFFPECSDSHFNDDDNELIEIAAGNSVPATKEVEIDAERKPHSPASALQKF